MHGLIAVQVAFCFLVLFIAGLFVATFHRLAHQTAGFSSERILNLQSVAQRAQPQVFWDQVAERLRAVPGVDRVALAGWPLLTGESWVGFVSVNGAPPDQVRNNFLPVSPGWIATMKIPFLDGRDFRAGDAYPGAAIVNEAFVKHYFREENPIGKTFASRGGLRFEIVGVVRDARYRYMREPIFPTVYVPFQSVDAKGALEAKGRGTFIVRTSGADPLALAQTLRREVSLAGPGFRVSDIHSQAELVRAQTVRERLLAMLAFFFATVALLLAGVGLYGVLDYSVLERRREIGIRRAVGAQAGDIGRRVTVDVLSMVAVGAAAGVALGLASVRYIESLLYQVKATDLGMLAFPSLAIVVAALVAALPAVIRTVRIDPVTMLRAE